VEFTLRGFSILGDKTRIKQPARRYFRKRIELFRLIDKIKLWPSRRGLLHGIKTVEIVGTQARITTHCNKTFWVTDSRNSRAARWLRNKWFKGTCGVCRIPEWKLAKYSSTRFERHYGSNLVEGSRVQGSEVQGMGSKVQGSAVKGLKSRSSEKRF
jgi:pyrrolysyl-tRNA synthetase-like protein